MPNTFIYKKTNISFTDIGKGNVVVLLHGFLENSTMWDKITPILSKKNRVITIDLLGHGNSENLSYVHTMEDQAQMVKAVLNHLKLRRYIIAGHSLGGYVALAFAELFTDNIKKLCLINSTALPDTPEKQINRDRAIKMVKQNKDTFIKIAIPNLFTKESKVKYKTEIDSVKKEALKTSLQGVIASLEGMKIRKDRTSILHNTTFEKLFIIGRKDPLLSYKTLINQTNKTNTKITEFTNGHMSHIENFDELILSLTNFVK
ncbi:MAG TPA: alpha/beta hydrolase [Flavobacteriaceae bacterium]|nr:alpha/beta hydrolase [Flavobacteriaceae bacterium]